MFGQNEYNAYQQYQKNMANPLDLYNKQVQELGVGDVRNRVSSLNQTLLNTENALNQVDPSVTGRTQGSLVTEAQRQRLVNLERQPLATQYGQQSRQLESQQGNLRDLLGQASQQSSLQYQGQQQNLQNLANTYNMAFEREKTNRLQQIEAEQRAFEREQAAWERQYKERELAAQIQAARSRASGGGGRGGGKTPNVDDAVALVNSLRTSGRYGDSGYGAIAEALRQRGYDISRDSVFDRGLRKAFGFGWQ